MKRKFTKHPVTASTSAESSDYIIFSVYELDEDGDEVDNLDNFTTLDEAVAFAQEQGVLTHVVAVPTTDPDDDPEIAEWFEYNSEYEPYEVVWSNFEG